MTSSTRCIALSNACSPRHLHINEHVRILPHSANVHAFAHHRSIDFPFSKQHAESMHKAERHRFEYLYVGDRERTSPHAGPISKPVFCTALLKTCDCLQPVYPCDLYSLQTATSCKVFPAAVAKDLQPAKTAKNIPVAEKPVPVACSIAVLRRLPRMHRKELAIVATMIFAHGIIYGALLAAA